MWACWSVYLLTHVRTAVPLLGVCYVRLRVCLRRQFSGPGLGIEIDEVALEGLLFDGFEPREAGKGPPREKMYPMEDGSAAEW